MVSARVIRSGGCLFIELRSFCVRPSFSERILLLVIHIRRLYSSVGEAIVGCMPINARAKVVPLRGQPPIRIGDSCDIFWGFLSVSQRLNRRVS